ncbi:Hypothetical predicted protein [Pelobates cultripes]|uniref:Uncharacterized protein n=1 Tax=Pelobates cultripes TaxID=61616 RepID=A0AAD1SHX7_PELCU|nr:Hypothetical predicted protein [Pelobates cultripes]
MASQKIKKQVEKNYRAGFFTTRAPTTKNLGLSEQEQDGDGGNDTLPLQTSPGAQNLPVTQDFLQKCLDNMFSKILETLQGTLREMKREMQELGDRMAHVENRMEEQATAHNEMAEQVKDIQQQLDLTQTGPDQTSGTF